MITLLQISFVLTAYLISSIPFGLVLTKIFLRTDIRKIGSGNIGATNVLRTGSKLLAIATVIFDAMKPYLSYLGIRYIVFPAFFGFNVTRFVVNVLEDSRIDALLYIYMYITAISLIGHCFPVWLKFKGGKGVATIFGSLFLFTNWWYFIPVLPFLALATWLSTAFISKKSSLSALTTALFLPLYVYWTSPYVPELTSILTRFFFGISLFVIIRHHANIRRLIKGTEDNIHISKSKK